MLHPQPGAALLATPRRQKLLENIWQRTSLSRAQFAALYRAQLERYAELVQQFPASESHHHAYPGGMLDHGLEIVAFALQLRQSYLLPVGESPETQAAQSEAWTAATAYSALLHDIGKVAVDLHVEYADGKRWHPWHGKPTRPYRFRYLPNRTYRLHGAATGLLYRAVLDTTILDWLSGFPELWSALLYVLAGQYEHAGVLGELVQQADRASVAQALGGDPAKARLAPKTALQRKLAEGLRYLVREELRLNQSQASDGWLTYDALWLVSKTICDKLRAHLLAHGVEGVPSSNTVLFDVLQAHGIAQATPEGKAVWRATVISASGWTQSFTFLRFSPALIWEPHERPPAFSGAIRIDPAASTDTHEAQAPSHAVSVGTAAAPADPDLSSSEPSTALQSAPLTSVLSLLDGSTTRSADDQPKPPAISTEPQLAAESQPVSTQKPVPRTTADVAAATDDSVGMQFLAWLQSGIQLRRLIINDAKALIHTVSGTIFLVSPGVFQRYAQEHPANVRAAKQDGVSDWAWVQKQFERLRLHKKHANGLNIWTCEVSGPRKTRRLHGYLLADGQAILPDIPHDNPHLKLLTASSEEPRKKLPD